jgi:hypothetical protein
MLVSKTHLLGSNSMQTATSSFRVEVVYPDNDRFQFKYWYLSTKTTDNEMIPKGWVACRPQYNGLLAIGLLLVRATHFSTWTHGLKTSGILSSRQ